MPAMRDLGERNKLEEGTNPIKHGNIGVSGIDAELYVFEILGGKGDKNATGSNVDAHDSRIIAGKQPAETRFLASEVQRLRRVVTDSVSKAVHAPRRHHEPYPAQDEQEFLAACECTGALCGS